MSSLGRLAAGVAHEINNPLGGIVVYSHLLLEDTPLSDPRRANLEKIVQQAMRCREIVQDLLGFARPPKSGEERLDLNRLLRTTLSVFSGQALFHNATIDWDLSRGPLWVMGDSGQLQQALSNIVLNAAQAMDGRGRLTIRSETAPEENVVRVTISDTGPGISSQDLPHLFEPFFTTKEAGQGTGLGLAISYGIVKRHRGTIDVTSRPGEGARFTVTLPGVAPPGNG
jgi:signal transduction histidine kinase